ncbi:hypothetical protein [Nocardia sp. SSK8]|uniref:hypothetical protein n=1 Tax=Nocardia sp. SSK8 TaxID=3120154 RepID=UPI00300A4524
MTALLAGPALAVAPVAAADAGLLDDAITLTSAGFCVGHIHFETVFGTETRYFGLVSALHGVGPCSVDAGVHWRNLDTGAAGTVWQRIYGTGGTQIEFDPGPGRIVGTITTDAPHKPGRFEFVRQS